MKTQHSKGYIIYGRIPPMTRFKPVAGSRFVTNLIHAEIFRPETSADMEKLQKELAFLNTQGEFELREVQL